MKTKMVTRENLQVRVRNKTSQIQTVLFSHSMAPHSFQIIRYHMRDDPVREKLYAVAGNRIDPVPQADLQK